MSSQRPGKVQEALREEISKIIQFELRDPRLGFITITRVDLTKDLRYARVYFSVLGEDREKKRALAGLNSASGYIKGLVADRVKLRFMPEIVFKLDESFQKTKEVLDILEKLKKERKEEGRDEVGDRGDKEA